MMKKGTLARLTKATKMKRIPFGKSFIYEGRPFWNVTATIIKLGPKAYRLVILDKNDDAPAGDLYWTEKTLTAALMKLREYGKRETTTYNMMNRAAGPITIDLAAKGGCCDPATETYWSM